MRLHKLILKLAKLISIFLGTLIFRIENQLLGNSIGKNAKVDGLVFLKFSSKGCMKIGTGLRINSRKRSNLVGIMNPASFQSIHNGQITIGDNCGLSGTVLSSRSSIKIGNNVMIGGNVRIFDHDYHSLKYMDRRDKKLDDAGCRTSPVFIEDDVFIGTNSIILKGVTIGARSVIGAGSIVSLKQIPPDSLVAGNPARILKEKVKSIE